METRASDERRGAMAKGTEGLLAEGAYHHGLGGWRHAYTSRMLVIAPINVVALGLCDQTTAKTLDDMLRLDAHFHDDLDMFGHVRRRHLFMYPCIHSTYQSEQPRIRRLRSHCKQDGGVERSRGREDRTKGKGQRLGRLEKKGEVHV
jgi:hypothetical protein